MVGAFQCSVCGSIITASAPTNAGQIVFNVDSVFPVGKRAHGDLPESARTYLEQADITAANAPDAAAVMAGSAVDAMLKAKNYTSGTLYEGLGG